MTDTNRLSLFLSRVPKAVLTSLSIAALAQPLAASADEIAPAGHFQATITDITSAEFIPDPGPNPGELEGDGFLLDQAVVVTSNTQRRRGIFDAMVGHCAGDEVLTNLEFGSITFGSCTYQDQDGDKIFEEFVIERTSLYTEASGEGVLIGGTGKYEGISGHLTHTRSLLILNQGVGVDFVLEGFFPGVGTLIGNYRLPRPAK